MRFRVSTLVYTHGAGRLGNQLIRFAHWLAWAEEHSTSVRVINLSFWPYARLFPEWAASRSCAYPDPLLLTRVSANTLARIPRALASKMVGRASRTLHSVARYIPGVQAICAGDSNVGDIDLDGNGFLSHIQRSRLTLCAGWRIYGWELLDKHQKRVHYLLRPSPSLLEDASRDLSDFKTSGDYIVGVHIRHGDYRIWDAGRYFHATQRYAEWMRERVRLEPHRRISFLVTSDEVQPLEAFRGLRVRFSAGSANAGGSPEQGLFGLSACDEIMAPPSTFAAWAACFGRKPWRPLGTPGLCGLEAPVAGTWSAIRSHPWLSRIL